MTRSSPITEERIRERAYLLWLEEGQPEGRHAEHWERARELLALEADPEEGKEASDEGYNDASPLGEPVEEAAILENQGEQEVPRKRKPTASKRRPKITKPAPAARHRPM